MSRYNYVRSNMYDLGCPSGSEACGMDCKGPNGEDYCYVTNGNPVDSGCTCTPTARGNLKPCNGFLTNYVPSPKGGAMGTFCNPNPMSSSYDLGCPSGTEACGMDCRGPNGEDYCYVTNGNPVDSGCTCTGVAQGNLQPCNNVFYTKYVPSPKGGAMGTFCGPVSQPYNPYPGFACPPNTRQCSPGVTCDSSLPITYIPSPKGGAQGLYCQ